MNHQSKCDKLSDLHEAYQSAYIPKTLLGEVEEITDTDKTLSVNKAINEGLHLWLKQNKKKAVNK